MSATDDQTSCRVFHPSLIGHAECEICACPAWEHDFRADPVINSPFGHVPHRPWTAETILKWLSIDSIDRDRAAHLASVSPSDEPDVAPLASEVEMPRLRPVLYVAGPYTNPDPVINTHAACRVGTALIEHTTWIPMIPHTSLLWHAVTPRPVEFWYALDLALMERCDAIVRLPGPSVGADNEVRVARELRLREIDFDDLPSVVQAPWLSRLGSE